MRIHPLFRPAALLFIISAGIVPALAQNYGVDWHTIPGGAGISSNTTYTISGTIGQPAAAHAAGDRYAIDSGFWAFAAVMQTPGAPRLTLQRASATTLVILWPSPSTDFLLQSATDIAAGNWAAVAMPPADDGTTKSVVISLSPGNQFFRLLKSGP
jgi:hypothetical protein